MDEDELEFDCREQIEEAQGLPEGTLSSFGTRGLIFPIFPEEDLPPEVDPDFWLDEEDRWGI